MLTGRARHAYKLALRAVIYAAIRPAVEVFRRLPPAAAGGLGAALAGGAWSVMPGAARRAVRNLGIALPELSEPARRRIAARHFRHLGRSAGEYLSLTTRDPGLLSGRVRIEGLDRLERARAAGRGVIVLTAHLGSWEMAAASVSLAIGGMGVVARDLYDPRISRLINRLREHALVRTYDTGDVRGLLRHLKGGGVLGILIDQDSRRVATVPVPYFGVPAATPVGPVRLADRAGAALMMGFIVRHGAGYRLVLEDLPPLPATAEGRLARFNARLESLVRAHPEQWVWLHDRWKSTLGERPGPSFGGAA